MKPWAGESVRLYYRRLMDYCDDHYMYRADAWAHGFGLGLFVGMILGSGIVLTIWASK